MKAGDVTDTLTIALQASGLASAKVIHRPRLLSDNGSSYIAGDLGSGTGASITSAARRCIPRPRARSNAGTRR